LRTTRSTGLPRRRSSAVPSPTPSPSRVAGGSVLPHLPWGRDISANPRTSPGREQVAVLPLWYSGPVWPGVCAARGARPMQTIACWRPLVSQRLAIAQRLRFLTVSLFPGPQRRPYRAGTWPRAPCGPCGWCSGDSIEPLGFAVAEVAELGASHGRSCSMTWLKTITTRRDMTDVVAQIAERFHPQQVLLWGICLWYPNAGQRRESAGGDGDAARVYDAICFHVQQCVQQYCTLLAKCLTSPCAPPQAPGPGVCPGDWRGDRRS
jgi:hypothetical protein